MAKDLGGRQESKHNEDAPMKNAEGIVETDPTARAQIHADHLAGVYNTARPRFDLTAVRADLASLQYPQPTAKEVAHFALEDNRPPSLEEVEYVVHSLKDKKASGPDQ